jgi:hypothetical protein
MQKRVAALTELLSLSLAALFAFEIAAREQIALCAAKEHRRRVICGRGRHQLCIAN